MVKVINFFPSMLLKCHDLYELPNIHLSVLFAIIVCFKSQFPWMLAGAACAEVRLIQNWLVDLSDLEALS